MGMKVYHGSNVFVREPSLSHGRKDADFGLGFYVSTSLEMAEKWAVRRKSPAITEYILNDEYLLSYLFGADKEWLDFVISNRSAGETLFQKEDYDLLIGITADDKLFSTIEQYEMDLISEETAIEVLNCLEIGNQICIRTEKGLDNLQFEREITLSPERIKDIEEKNKNDRNKANEMTRNIIRESVKPKNNNGVER